MKPSNDFTFKILADADFDKLPYPDAKDSLGMSVMATKTAYIRKTGVKDIDMGTIQHEFDELMQKVSPHEVNGIRYKKASKIFTNIFKSIAAYATGGPIGGILNDVSATIEGVQTAGAKKQNKKLRNQQADQVAQQQNIFGGSGPSGATQAFAPQAAQPLGQKDFNTSLANLDSNAAATRESVFSKFKGLGAPEGNTAFSNSLSSAGTSSKLARDNFLSDQKKLGSTFV